MGDNNIFKERHLLAIHCSLMPFTTLTTNKFVIANLMAFILACWLDKIIYFSGLRLFYVVLRSVMCIAASFLTTWVFFLSGESAVFAENEGRGWRQQLRHVRRGDVENWFTRQIRQGVQGLLKVIDHARAIGNILILLDSIEPKVWLWVSFRGLSLGSMCAILSPSRDCVARKQ